MQIGGVIKFTRALAVLISFTLVLPEPIQRVLLNQLRCKNRNMVKKTASTVLARSLIAVSFKQRPSRDSATNAPSELHRWPRESTRWERSDQQVFTDGSGEITPSGVHEWKRLVAVVFDSETVEQARADECVVVLLFQAPDGVFILQNHAIQ